MYINRLSLQLDIHISEHVNIKYKICLIEVYLLKYYFESHLIYNIYYGQTIFNQLNIMVPSVYGFCHCVSILREIYVMQHKYHV